MGRRYHKRGRKLRRRSSSVERERRPDAAALWLRGDPTWKKAAAEINLAAIVERRSAQRRSP